MDIFEAINHIGRLNLKWGRFSGELADKLTQIQDGILAEYRAARDGRIPCSAGLIAEMHGELILCGKLRKVLERDQRDREFQSIQRELAETVTPMETAGL